MARPGVRDLAVGVVFSLALVIAAVTIMAVGGASRLFSPKARYSVVFPSAEGLVVGSPVKMSGVVVGGVSDIRLSTDPGTLGIEVEVGVDRSFVARVREDSGAALRILQLLSGEKFVEIIPGSPERPLLPERSLIETKQDKELLEQAAITAENLNEITISLKNILGKMESGEGLIGQMINDPEFGREGLTALREALKNLHVITADMRQGRGIVGRLLSDESFARQAEDMFAALGKVAEVIERLDLERGAMGALLSEDGPGQRAVEDFAASAASMRRIAERLEAGQGIVGQMLGDSSGEQQAFARDLGRLTANLAEITDKINRGEGTLGALVNDDALYESLQDVVTGVNDSKFTRWLMRRYQKKGIKAQDSQAEPRQQPDSTGP